MKVLRKEIEERRCFALIETGEQLYGGFVFEPTSQEWVLRAMNVAIHSGQRDFKRWKSVWVMTVQSLG